MVKHRKILGNFSKQHLLIILFLFFIFPYATIGQCPGTACTYTITGADSGSYTVNTGEKICFDPGADFTGTIDLEGGEIINCATNPQTFTFSTSPFGVLNNYGIINYSANHSYTNGLTVNNYNTINANANLTIVSGAILNNFGNANIDGTLINQSQINNSGTIIIQGSLSENNTSFYPIQEPLPPIAGRSMEVGKTQEPLILLEILSKSAVIPGRLMEDV